MMNDYAPTESMVRSPYRFEYFFNISPDLLCIAGFDGYFKKINPAVSALLGYSTAELYARPVNDFIHPDDRKITSEARNALTRNNPLIYFENRYVKKSGEIVWLAWTSMPVEEDQLVFAIAKNITHKKKVDEERNELLANLTRMNNSLKQLTYTTSHDLRSPVNNLLLVFSMLDVSKINDPETVTFIEMLKSSAEGLRLTLNNYVDALSKKEGLHTNVEEVNFQECMNIVLFSINALTEHSKATLHINFSALPTIYFNKAYLESIFLNLITNSIKYAKPGRLPEITITTRIENGKKQLLIADNGLGFDVDYVTNKMFGMHQKLHQHTDSKGIGLYLVHNHVTSLGGKIAVESKLNEGATFTITFEG